MGPRLLCRRPPRRHRPALGDSVSQEEKEAVWGPRYPQPVAARGVRGRVLRHAGRRAHHLPPRRRRGEEKPPLTKHASAIFFCFASSPTSADPPRQHASPAYTPPQGGDPWNELLRYALYTNRSSPTTPVGNSSARVAPLASVAPLPKRAWAGSAPQATQPRGAAILPDLSGMLVASARTSTSAVLWVRLCLFCVAIHTVSQARYGSAFSAY